MTTKTPLRDERGNAIGLIGITRDISDRKLAEAEAAASERRFRTIAATIPGAIFQFSNRNGVWTVDYMSDRCYDIIKSPALVSSEGEYNPHSAPSTGTIGFYIIWD